MPDEIAACRPFLDQQVALIVPRVVLTLGNFATRLLLDTTRGITQLRGQSFPFGTDGAVLLPTYHPAAALRGGGEVVARMRADFVRARAALDSRPPGRRLRRPPAPLAGRQPTRHGSCRRPMTPVTSLVCAGPAAHPGRGCRHRQDAVTGRRAAPRW